MTASPPRASRPTPRACAAAGAARAFSLLEVVIAVGVFAVGMMAVFGLFAPVAKSVADNSDAAVAAQVAEAVHARLQGQKFDDVVKLLKNSTTTGHELTDADAKSDYDVAADKQLLFASRDGLKVGAYGESIWVGGNREKFFEIALIRNETLSPRAASGTDEAGNTVTVDPVATAAVLAYTLRVRWPAFVADSGAGAIQIGSNPTGAVKFDQGHKQALLFAGAVTR
jgi:type II secretory pathway pseudopilin PulG